MEDNPSSQKQKRHLKTSDAINDFDLMNIPPNIDLNCIMKEVVIPRLPDGFTVKIEEKSIERKNSFLRIINSCKFGMLQSIYITIYIEF